MSPRVQEVVSGRAQRQALSVSSSLTLPNRGLQPTDYEDPQVSK